MTLEINVRGDDEIVRAAERWPAEANQIIKKHIKTLTRHLATRIKAAGRADSRQSARAARTVRARSSSVIAGPHPLLFGSEFGANGRYGWYGANRYRNSTDRQFRPHLGRGSYWFFKTAEAEQPALDHTAQQIGNDMVRAWGAR
jgi:hypothetical protein